VPDGPATALLEVRQVGILRKLRQQRRIERRHLSLAQRDPVKQADDALAHGPQFVAALGRERDAFKMRSPVFVPHLIVAPPSGAGQMDPGVFRRSAPGWLTPSLYGVLDNWRVWAEEFGDGHH
jgi:hypothetical protein